MNIKEKIGRLGFFDEKFYCQSYPEACKGDISPLDHYLEIGWKEEKNPSLSFNSSWYLNSYPDVAKSGINPLVHYIEFGIFEGRFPAPSFCWNKRLDYPGSVKSLFRSHSREKAA
ncbi:hypothetical protein [Candidatus Methylacidiphilum infernorum]|uniref:hypothetical protein n=1 Tax=Candidatus Methylacidiphilum infernorum TaxID=511746 RepID=UPI001F5D3A24|nr:hypothetical protein [Candidatus Methylacidiphilum infernorum]